MNLANKTRYNASKKCFLARSEVTLTNVSCSPFPSFVSFPPATLGLFFLFSFLSSVVSYLPPLGCRFDAELAYESYFSIVLLSPSLNTVTETSIRVVTDPTETKDEQTQLFTVCDQVLRFSKLAVSVAMVPLQEH